MKKTDYTTFTPTQYKLVNAKTGRIFEDTGWCLSDPECPDPALVRAQYEKKQIDFKDPSWGIYRFADWLPINRCLQGSAAPVTYKSKHLAAYLGLDQLYITFNGWWPKHEIRMETCSFKETEAFSVCCRLPLEEKRTLVVASAGNTARAFAKVCSENKIPLLLCVPLDNINALWFKEPLDPCVHLVCTPSGSDYYDAIALGDIACKLPQFFAEGGAKNIARRDGMATTLLSAAEMIGRIPDYYFQSVGSGTGAIAAWEAAQRLKADGRFGKNNMRLMVSQNLPFLPIYRAWEKHDRHLPPMDPEKSRLEASAIEAKVLSNRKPPYGIHGGLYDALTATDGCCDCVTNTELNVAKKIFRRTEGIDIYSAAAVAVSSLVARAQNGFFKPDEVIMLNITGGGEKHFKRFHKITYLKPELVLDPAQPEEDLLRAFNAL